ncbi:Transcriptional repressor RcnR [Pandoraea apista]|nr:Transcriptional repressor RcnR [Pandoraea apista]
MLNPEYTTPQYIRVNIFHPLTSQPGARQTVHTIRDKSKLLARVRRIQGQAQALERQLNEESDCVEILQQIAAIRGAVNGLMGAVIEGHLVDHLVNEPGQANREAELAPVLHVIKAYLK